MKEGSEKDQEAVQEILKHLINLAGIKQKGKNKSKVRAVVGVPAEAFRVSRQNLRNTMEGIADSVMLVSEPFAVAYGLEALLHALVIDIGAGTADFCVMQGRYPTEDDQRTLSAAGDSIDEQLEKLVRERYPEAQFSVHMIRQWKERFSFVGEPKDRVIVTTPVKGKATELDITDEMRTACESILPPICETLQDILSKVEPDFQDKVRNNVILAGGDIANHRIDRRHPKIIGRTWRWTGNGSQGSSVRRLGRWLGDRPRCIEFGLGKAIAVGSESGHCCNGQLDELFIGVWGWYWCRHCRGHRAGQPQTLHLCRQEEAH